VFSDGLIRLQTVRYTLQHTSWARASSANYVNHIAIARLVLMDLPRNRAW